jgi:hypothetical protein
MLVCGLCGIESGKGGRSWGAIYLVETGLELGQDICHNFVVEGAERVDSGRSVRKWGRFAVALSADWTVGLRWRFCSFSRLEIYRSERLKQYARCN